MVWSKYDSWKASSTKEWEVELTDKCVDEDCPDLSDGCKIELSAKAYSQIKTLLSMYPQHEWMAGLVGREKDDGNLLIESLKLFEQEVTGANVELTDKGNEEIAKYELIGWIHSHNTMNVFLSETDVSTASFTTVSICVNNKLDFEVKMRKKLGCGRFGLVESEITIESVEDDDIRKDAEKLITTKTYNLSSLAVDEDYCLYCGKKVGKRNRRLCDNGVVHRKCFKSYMEELRSDAYLEDRFDTDGWGESRCQFCGESPSYCNCEEVFRRYEGIQLDYITD